LSKPKLALLCGEPRELGWPARIGISVPFCAGSSVDANFNSFSAADGFGFMDSGRSADGDADGARAGGCDAAIGAISN